MARSRELITAELSAAQAQIAVHEQMKTIATLQHQLATNMLPNLRSREEGLRVELESLPKETPNVDAKS